LKSILLHELAHIHHRDQIIGVIKRIVLTVHWFNPLVYIINREYEQAREEVSDNYVLQELHPMVYTQCLADLAEKVCLISNFPAAVGMAGGCFNLRTRVEHILSNKGRVSMRTKIYLKTIVFTSCLVLTFGISGLHGKVKSVMPGDAVAEEQKNLSVINPVSLFEERPKLLQVKVAEVETIKTQDEDNSRVISNKGITLQYESSDQPVLKNVSPGIVMAHNEIKTGKNPQKKTESIKTIREHVLSNDTEDSIVVAQKKPTVEASSDAARVTEARAVEQNPEDAGAYINRGRLYHFKGEYEKAVSDYGKSIELNPKDDITKKRQEYALARKQYPLISAYHIFVEKEPEPYPLPHPVYVDRMSY
jgi:tetratricopeptide (TPR) repeat protein